MDASSLTGWTLIAGALMFGIGAGNPRLARAWTASQPAFLGIVAAHPTAWRSTNVLFVAGTVVVAAGLAMVPEIIPDPTARGLALGGAAGYLVAAVLWIVSLLYRLAVTPVAAASYLASGAMDPAIEPLDRLSGALFASFIVVGLTAVGVTGIALATSAVVPAIVGWGCAGLSALLIGGLYLTGDMPPFTVYLAPLVYGVLIVVGG